LKLLRKALYDLLPATVAPCDVALVVPGPGNDRCG
jgi:hypothetical protein